MADDRITEVDENKPVAGVSPVIENSIRKVSPSRPPIAAVTDSGSAAAYQCQNGQIASAPAPTAHEGPHSMQNRSLAVLGSTGLMMLCAVIASGCRGHQYAQVLDADQRDMVGSHEAGAETFKPLIDESVARLLVRHQTGMHAVSYQPGVRQPMQVCFVGVENRSAEEIGDFKDQIYQQIDTQLVNSEQFHPVSRRFVEAAMRQMRARPDELLLPQYRRQFAALLQREGQPVDFLLFATITSGTTRNNNSYQRDYLLTLELVNVHTGDYDKESATLRKGYHRTRVAAWKNYWPFH